ncbi:MAG: SsrA-binding protein, partial [Bacteroidales bacterium]
MKKEKKHNIVIRNKKASHDYIFIDTFITGIQLTGTEIKSIRAGKASLTDSYCRFRNGELYVTGMNISEYFWGNINNHETRRERKLLLHKKELRKL